MSGDRRCFTNSIIPRSICRSAIVYYLLTFLIPLAPNATRVRRKQYQSNVINDTHIANWAQWGGTSRAEVDCLINFSKSNHLGIESSFPTKYNKTLHSSFAIYRKNIYYFLKETLLEHNTRRKLNLPIVFLSSIVLV